MSKNPNDIALGTVISFKAGPTRKLIENCTVVGHEGQFVIAKDESGFLRKVRPGSILS